MQVLKQILEEIESLGREHPYKILGIPDTYSQYNEAWQDCVDRVEGIIQRRMIETEPNTVVEWCPHCEKEIEICWDVEKDGYQIFCPNCGKAIMLCSMCDGGICDWTEKGCKRMNSKWHLEICVQNATRCGKTFTKSGFRNVLIFSSFR